MLEKTVSYNGANVTVRRASVKARLYSTILFNRLGLTESISAVDFYVMQTYVRFLTQTSIAGDVGFPVPALSAEADELRAGFEAFLDAPEGFYDVVIDALNSVDFEANPPELQPEISQKKA